MKYAELKPGILFFADLGWGGIEYLQPVICERVTERKNVFDEPRISVYTRCNQLLDYGPEELVKFNGDWRD